MAWDGSKSKGSELTSTEWNNHVSHQKNHATEHEAGGAQEILHNNLNISSNDHHTRPTAGNYLSDSSNTFNHDNAQFVIDHPNGQIPTTTIADTDSAEITVPVPNGQTLTVYVWGGYRVPAGDAPTGLVVELLDGGDTSQASANTVRTASTTGVASLSNSSGSLSVYKLRVSNGTGAEEDIAATFGYEVA